MRRFRVWVVYPATALLVYLLYYLARALPLEWASAMGGFLFRALGNRMRVAEVARRNLRRAFPELSGEEIERILRGMWENLGRGAGEFAHLDRFDIHAPDSRIEVIGREHLEALRDDGRPGIVFSAHLANWELDCLVAAQLGLPLGQIYRSAANPWLDRLFRRARSCIGGELFPKGRTGAAAVVRFMRAGGHLGVLVDQKMNEGIPIPFFGRDAMTATAPAELALKFNAPLVPARMERLPGVRFRLTVYPPMDLPDTGDRNADLRLLLTRMTAMIEEWIREHPEQWFWVHRRWPD